MLIIFYIDLLLFNEIFMYRKVMNRKNMIYSMKMQIIINLEQMKNQQSTYLWITIMVPINVILNY